MMTEQSNQQPIDVFTRKWLLIESSFAIPIFFLFAVLGDPGRGRAAGICVYTLMTAICALWNLNRHIWFWVTAALMVILHASLVLVVPWPSGSFPAFSLLPVAVLDYGIVYGFIKLAEMMMTKKAPPPEDAPSSDE
jgi:hypothetical protein